MSSLLSNSKIHLKNRLTSIYIIIPETIHSFQFDCNNIKEKFVLINIACYIIEDTIDKYNLNIDKEKMGKFIENVAIYYHNNYFHNFQHAVNVLQMVWLLLYNTNVIGKLNENVLFGLLVAALCHDIDHPGNTNSYEINSMSKISMLYNDISVLENHHCAITFDLLIKNKIDKDFSLNNFKEFRKTIIDCILSTDMLKHNELIGNFHNFDMSKETYTFEEQLLVSQIILHCADLSNIIKNFEDNLYWVKKLLLEYHHQTLKEEHYGLPILSFMRAQDDISMCKNEINFIKNISQPLWEIFVEKNHSICHLNNYITSNLNNWEKLLEEYKKESSFENM